MENYEWISKGIEIYINSILHVPMNSLPLYCMASLKCFICFLIAVTQNLKLTK